MAVDVQSAATRAISTTAPPETYNFSFKPFLKANGFILASERPVCQAFREGHCPRGRRCPDRHPSAPSAHSSTHSNLVCKHWLKGLCKKGEDCDFLHEYNLRRMSECQFYTKNGYCQNGDECLYLHVNPESRLPPCENYQKGFCELGPKCAKRHIRKKMCPFYLAGFCPDGPMCKEGVHARWETVEKPTVKVEKTKEEIEQDREKMREHAEKEEEKDREWRRENRGRYGRGRYRNKR